MLLCNAYGGGTAPIQQTVATTQQTVACKTMCPTLVEAEDDVFYNLVIDALNRIAGPNRLNISAALVSNLTADDINEANNNAICSLRERQITLLDPMKAKAIILAQLNNILCT